MTKVCKGPGLGLPFHHCWLCNNVDQVQKYIKFGKLMKRRVEHSGLVIWRNGIVVPLRQIKDPVGHLRQLFGGSVCQTRSDIKNLESLLRRNNDHLPVIDQSRIPKCPVVAAQNLHGFQLLAGVKSQQFWMWKAQETEYRIVAQQFSDRFLWVYMVKKGTERV